MELCCRAHAEHPTPDSPGLRFFPMLPAPYTLAVAVSTQGKPYLLAPPAYLDSHHNSRVHAHIPASRAQCATHRAGRLSPGSRVRRRDLLADFAAPALGRV